MGRGTRSVAKKIPATSRAIYLNPYVPACDLGIYPHHAINEITEYHRRLDMDKAIAEVTYTVDEVRYKREYLSSWPEGVIVIRLSASQAGRISGEVTLSRMLDPDCEVTGSSSLGEVVLEGAFEEGVRFATVVRVVQHGGRLTGGRREYLAPAGTMPPKDLDGGQFIFRDKDYPYDPIGVSTCFDCADEVLLLVATATEDEAADDLVGWCRSKLRSVPVDADRLIAEHVQDHRSLYRRVSLSLGSECDAVPTDALIEESRKTGIASPRLLEQMFNMGRYLAITSGRPQPKGQPCKAPINLQGIWNQDRRPAWDSDYHLDLNLEMCYWPLDQIGMGDLVIPMMDWVESLLPQANHAAMDLYGCRGALFPAICDLRHLGNIDDLLFAWTGAGAWIAQLLWHHWEYSGDELFLRFRLYPLMKEIGQFYEDYLIYDQNGRLVPVPSASPEMGIKGRKRYSTLSSPSSIDLELIREIFSHLLSASQSLGMDTEKRQRWSDILSDLPMPAIDGHGCLQEWADCHEPIDPGHRHRSPFIALCPGNRITLEDTPDYHEAARKLLHIRLGNRQSTVALTSVWDAQIWTRLYDGDAALKELSLIAHTWLIDNLLLSHCDWRDDTTTLNWFPGKKLFQIEASIGILAALSEMLLQDRRALLRILPALPKTLKQGEIKGLHSRGGFEVELIWAEGQLVQSTIRSIRGERCKVKCFAPERQLAVFHSGSIHEAVYDEDVVEFSTERGESYILRPK